MERGEFVADVVVAVSVAVHGPSIRSTAEAGRVVRAAIVVAGAEVPAEAVIVSVEPLRADRTRARSFESNPSAT